jgi:hypothetical protein
MLNRKTCTTLALTLTLAVSPLLGGETEAGPLTRLVTRLLFIRQ